MLFAILLIIAVIVGLILGLITATGLALTWVIETLTGSIR